MGVMKRLLTQPGQIGARDFRKFARKKFNAENEIVAAGRQQAKRLL